MAGVPGALRVGFRPLTAGDLPLLAGWLATPHVAEWWQDPGDLGAYYLPRVQGAEQVHCLVVSWDGVPCGMFQHYPWTEDPELGATVGARPGEAGIDYLIGDPALVGRGLGRVMLAEFIARIVLADPAVTGIRVDVHAANVRSRRTLEKLGFGLEPGREFSDAGDRYVVYARGRV